ncbi:Aspartate/methionine/tyrosine aminotransferase [Persephonella hydrogeniphila]|uniref:Aspartate/methionine/tyrosine aminotransferase n=1 Tax=Persephonella hydrogeniphila TaxID=198703 RepID=A0A285MYY4_9AQUI|nr:pyridoxal phosphate-dependent aminotransferase [Persephonella hydrogeniphila]SNZ02404.1 Aspartate/methionine/tyrosine aminotransferase [Persephonella hydrogeniphila]
MNRLSQIKPFIVMDIVKKASQIKNAIHFEIGEPDLQPPPAVWELAEKAIKERQNHYTESLGLLKLREKIAEFYYRKYNVDINPERIALTVGTSGAFLVAYSILLNAGEKVALTDPSYPCYKNFAHLLDISPVLIPTGKETEYQLRPEQLEKHSDIKAVHISSPSNPVGNIYSEENLKSLTEYCDEKEVYFISDEIYHGLVYEGKEHTALEFSDKAVVINGFSKYFCMPGFRLGWIILPEELMRKAEIVMQNVFISPPTVSQYAALGAFDYEHLEKNRLIFKERRDFLFDQLKKIFDIDAKPQGAFYIWANVEKYCGNSFKFAQDLLEKAGVAVTPGIDFGKNNTEKYIRFAYTRDIQHMKEGIERIKKFLEDLQ